MAVVAVKALACELPAETGVPLSRWSAPELVVEAIDRGIVATISAATVRRWLRGDALKPWQHRSWIYPRAPDFAARAARVLDLYAGSFQDRRCKLPRTATLPASRSTSVQRTARASPRRKAQHHP